MELKRFICKVVDFVYFDTGRGFVMEIFCDCECGLVLEFWSSGCTICTAGIFWGRVMNAGTVICGCDFFQGSTVLFRVSIIL